MSPQTQRNLVGTIVVIILLAIAVSAIWILLPPPKPKTEAISNAKAPATEPSRVSLVDMPVVQAAVPAGPKPRAINSTIPALSFDTKDGARENFDHLGYFNP